MTGNNPKETRRRRFIDVFHNPYSARVVLLAALALTASAWYISRSVVNDAAAERFEFRTKEIESAIQERMTGYEQVLWGGVGLFNASSNVSRQEWAEYVNTIDLTEQWPGIQGLGYAIPVSSDGLDAHVTEIRAQGFPNYDVAPTGMRNEYTAIVYLEPFDWRNQRAFGYDMWSNMTRREAMTRARDTGKAATSGVITLVQETDQDVQLGFLTYVPVYRSGAEPADMEERRAAFVGWVYAAFRIDDLMHGVLGPDDGAVDYEIYDNWVVRPDALLYDSNGTYTGKSGQDDRLARATTVSFQGRPWTFAFRPGPEFEAIGADNLPTTIAVAGIVIDLLLFYAITSLGLLNRRATALADDMTAELRTTTERLRERSSELEKRATELKRSNAELAQFAHVASHDLQEPLRTMGSYSTLLTERYGGALGENGNRWLDYVAASSDRLSELIHDLLEYSTAEADPEEFDAIALDRVMDRVIDNLSDAIAKSGAVIECVSLPVVNGDRTQLERLLQNLISNAIKYRRAGETPRISIEVQPDEYHHRIVVRDNGIGIKPEYHDRIFEIFRRVGSQQDYPGTGIGLAICRKIVENHGGEIGVSSQPDRGSDFWFTLTTPPPDRSKPRTSRRESALTNA